jgi:hypothetical protein
VRARRARSPGEALSGALLALSSTALAIAAHGWAGGGSPDIALVLPVAAVIAWGGTALAGRLRRVPVLVAVLGLLQGGLHLLLSQSAVAHAHHGSTAPAVNGWLMLAGHALATVLTAALLARAAGLLAAVSSAIDWLRAQLLVPQPIRVTESRRRVGEGVSALPVRPGPLLEVQLRRVRARRGPPTHS